MIEPPTLQRLIERTYKFLGNLSPVSPTMRTNLKILQNTQNKLCEEGRVDDNAETSIQRAYTDTSNSSDASGPGPSVPEGFTTGGFLAANAHVSFGSAYSQ